MVEFENPVAGHIFWRFAGPLVPVWLVGMVLVFALDRLAVGGSTLGTVGLAALLVVYSLVVAVMVSLLYYREYRHSPWTVTLDIDGIAGSFPGTTPPVGVEYGAIVRIDEGGYFPARVEARSPGGTTIAWINVTRENAARVAEAWGAWRERHPTA